MVWRLHHGRLHRPYDGLAAASWPVTPANDTRLAMVWWLHHGRLQRPVGRMECAIISPDKSIVAPSTLISAF